MASQENEPIVNEQVLDQAAKERFNLTTTIINSVIEIDICVAKKIVIN